jgi:serine/threonine-protein kinase
VPAAAHQSVLDRATAVHSKPRSSALQGAIATIVLLGLAGAAFAYRDHIPGLSGLVGKPATTSSSSVTPATAAATSSAATAPSASDSIKASIANSTETPPPVPAPGSADAVAPSAPAVPPPPAAPQVVVNDAGTSVQSGDGNRVVVGADGSQVVQSADGSSVVVDSAGNTSVKAPGVSVDTSGNATAVRIAKIAPPDKPAAPPKPRVPTIAVVAAGDDVISSPAEDAMVSLLQSRGFRVIEGGRTHGDRPNLGALAGRADAVVFVNARPVGSQQINYYGQSSTLYTVQLGVKAYRIDGSVLWTGGGEQVNFTTLNAAEKAREAIEPILDQVDGRLDEFRSRGKRG